MNKMMDLVEAVAEHIGVSVKEYLDECKNYRYAGAGIPGFVYTSECLHFVQKYHNLLVSCVDYGSIELTCNDPIVAMAWTAAETAALFCMDRPEDVREYFGIEEEEDV